MAMRSKLLRQLLQVPGSFTKLRPAPESPGFFIDTDSTLTHTKGVVVTLPIHPKSSVTLSRPVPPIPGVPVAATTVPPVFMDPGWAEKLAPPKFRFDYMERTGKVYGLPFGYTTCPSTFIDVYEMKGIQPSKSSLKNGASRSQVSIGFQKKTKGFKAPRKPTVVDKRKKSIMGVQVSDDDVLMPLNTINNSAMSKLIIAAIGESRRFSNKTNHRGSQETGFGFVKRKSTLTAPTLDTLDPDASNTSLSSRNSLSSRHSLGEESKPIPTGMLRTPPKEDLKPDSPATGMNLAVSRTKNLSSSVPAKDPSHSDHGRNPPTGFILTCPFPGYDPEKVDRQNLPPSSIYGRGSTTIRSRSSSAVEEYGESEVPSKRKSAGVRNDVAPQGFTFERNPILWPNKNPTLIVPSDNTDFPLHAPVVFDIIQPGNANLQRVLCQITGINKDVSAVSVQKSSSDGMLSIGATFNLFMRTRSKQQEWNCINLEVIDDDLEDNISFGNPRSRGATLGSLLSSAVSIMNTNHPHQLTGRRPSASPLRPQPPGSAGGGASLPSTFPIPAGFTSINDPYFAPPVNIPPMPSGYTKNLIPFYGKSNSAKPQPHGVTTDGIRFYSPDGKLSEGVRNVLAGYDNFGHPFYIPKGCNLPPPVGFTADGIAYYDIPSMMHQRGIMILPASIKNKLKWALDRDLLQDFEDNADNSLEITDQLLATLMTTQPELMHSSMKGIPKAIGTIRRLKDMGKSMDRSYLESENADFEINEPEDIVDYLRENEDFDHLRPSSLKVTLEPNILDYQGVIAPVTKTCVLRYRAARGDREEKDIYVSVEPVEVFKVEAFHLKLQGDGMQQIQITYTPTSMQTEKVEGSMTLIDKNGKKLATCGLFALKRSFVVVTPTHINAGWILPDKSKDLTLKLENTSTVTINVAFELESEIEARTATATVEAMLEKHGGDAIKLEAHEIDSVSSSAFIVGTRTQKLQPGESRIVTVTFAPTKLGQFADVLEIAAPGGDTIRVRLSGVAGIPIAIYPENAKNSLSGGEALTIERSEFMKKFRSDGSGLKTHIPLTDDDICLIQNMMSATADAHSRKEAHTLDFGICSTETQTLMRCLTILNLSESLLTLGLYSHHPSIVCPYLIKVPPRMAVSVEVQLTVGSNFKGNFTSALEVICPEFQNIPVTIKSYVGDPLYFSCWEMVFFKPCMIGQNQPLLVNLVNQSGYELEFALGGIDLPNSGESYFTTSVSTDAENTTKVRAFSVVPVQFVYYAKRRGPLIASIHIQLVKPFSTFPSNANSSKVLSLIGICIEPWVHKSGELPDKNGFEFMRAWLSHPRRVLDEYPADDNALEKRFDIFSSADPSLKTSDCGYHFMKEELLFRLPKPSTGVEDDLVYRRASIVTAQLRNKSLMDVQVLLLSSPTFSIDLRTKILRKGEGESVEIMYTPPHDNNDYFANYGFAIAVSDLDHKFQAVQLLGRPHADMILYPTPGKDGHILLDFGRIEMSTNSLDINIKQVIFSNISHSSLSWTVKILTSRSKFCPFEIPFTFGEVHANEAFSLPFKFRSEMSGAFENIAEVEAKDAMDRVAKPEKIATIILRGQIVSTSLSGFPESLDFGSVVVSQVKVRNFTVSNNGTTETKVTLLTRAPFSVSPNSFSVAPKGTQEISVRFQPNESRTSVSKILIFSNHRLYMVNISGCGGTAELVCEKYNRKDIDFGPQREGTVAWLHLYLTNKGTLPLQLTTISSDLPDLIRLEYLKVTSTMPYELGQSVIKNVSIRKDYWGLVKRKLRIFTLLSSLGRKSSSNASEKHGSKRKPIKIPEEVGVMLSVLRSSDLASFDPPTSPLLPQLKPFYSYHFKLGYLNKYQPKKDTDVTFHYTPITSSEENNSILAWQQMSVRVIGNVYRPLEFFPAFHDFGIVPAESWQVVDSWKLVSMAQEKQYGVQKEDKPDSRIFLLEVLNFSMEPQNLALDFINSEFAVNGRNWYVLPGQKLVIPISFHPSKEQVQYQGEAIFTHTYGSQTIQLYGTGASAEVFADEFIDFGCLKLGSRGTCKLRICNRGLLDARYMVEIIQPGTDFRFANSEPFELESTITSGVAELIEIECCSQSTYDVKAEVVLKWERIPEGVWELINIPISLQIGLPKFKLSLLELDFKTTYINVNKTLVLTAVNDGNASCAWQAEWECDSVMIDPDDGVLNPGESVNIYITYVPENYDQLNSEIQFVTDAGPPKQVMCYGIVGIPYLIISEEDLNTDFGIAAVDKTHVRPISLRNSGIRPIEFEISITETLKDGMSAPDDDFAVFFAVPSFGVVEPGDTFSVKLESLPRNYGSRISSTVTVRTKDGEQYIGYVSVTGGRAIVKIAPPTIENPAVRQTTAEVKRRRSVAIDQNVGQSSIFETARLAFQSHIENLQDVLAGLRTAEMEFADELLSANSRNEAGLPPLGSSFPSPERMSPASQGSLRKQVGFTPTGMAEVGKLAQVGQELVQKQEEDYQRRISAGGKVFDGSDLRNRVKRAVEMAKKMGAESLTTPLKDITLEDDDDFVVARKTASGKVRIAAKDIDQALTELTADPDARLPPRDSASARRRRQVIEENHADIENSTAVQYVDDLSVLESELETLSKTIDAVGVLVGTTNLNDLENAGSRGSGESGMGRYQPGTPKRGPFKSHGSSKSTSKGASRKTTKQSNREAGIDEFPLPIGTGTNATPEADKQRIEDLMTLAQQILTNAAGAGDPQVQKKIVEDINTRLIASTKGIIKAVKDQLANRWVGNREFLSVALKKVQDTTRVMEALSMDQPNFEKLENEFSLGLIKANTKSENVMLFNLPNLGNLPFDFNIRPSEGTAVAPEGYSIENNMLFVVEPSTGTVEPDQSINFSASFESPISGSYHQGYELESSGEIVLKFHISVRVGKPQMELEPPSLDFGLVCKNRSDKQTIILANIGSFTDFWRIESVEAAKAGDDDDSGDGNDNEFKLNITHGELEPNESIPIQVTFLPKMEGNFVKRMKLVWSGEPKLLEIRGTGGGSRIKAMFMEPTDIKFGGFDWGTCIVDCVYQKQFQITNAGNVDGSFTIQHIRSTFRFEAPYNSEGKLVLQPGSTLNATMIYSPLVPEAVKDPVQIIVEDSQPLSLPLRAAAGIRAWTIMTELALKNMPMTEIQTSSISIQSSGGLDIPVDWKLHLEDEKHRKVLKVKVKDLKEQGEGVTLWIKPNQTLRLDVQVTPIEQTKIEGVVTVSTDLGKGRISKTFPFKFYAYDKPVALEDTNDASVGRIMFGETAEVSRDIVNYGAKAVKYRVRIEPLHPVAEADPLASNASLAEKAKSPKKKGKKARSNRNLIEASEVKQSQSWISPWKVKLLGDEMLLPNQSNKISIVFESMEEYGDEWHDAKAVIEQCDDEDRDVWSEVSWIKLTGAGGIPKLVIDPEVYEFGYCGLNLTKRSSFVLRNEGSAVLDYEIEEGWDFDGNITLEDSSHLKGHISPGECSEITLLFTPTEVLNYETSITFNTRTGPKYLRILGEGVVFQIYEPVLPRVVQFGGVGFAESAQIPLTVFNGCVYPISVAVSLQSNDPDSGADPIASEFLSIDPPIFNLEPNKAVNPLDETERGKCSGIITLTAPIPIDSETGLADSTAVKALIAKGTKRHYLKLETIGGSGPNKIHHIAVTFQFAIKGLAATTIPRFNGFKRGEPLDEQDYLTKLEFGEVGMGTGGSMSFGLVNLGQLKLSVSLQIESESFKVFPDKCILNPKGGRELRVELLPLEFGEEEEVPLSQAADGILHILPSLESMPKSSIPLTGVLIDEPPTMEIPEAFDFGSVRRQFISERILSFKNSARRLMTYNLTGTKDWADIFQLPGNELSVQGSAKYRHQVDIPIVFRPKASGSFDTQLTLETNQGVFTIKLHGDCVEANVLVDKSKLSFGVVGVDAPEFREVSISNPTSIPVRISARSQGGKRYFLASLAETGEEEMTLAPGETRNIRIVYSPDKQSSRNTDTISLFNMDLHPGQEHPEVLAKVEVEGVGGVMDFRPVIVDKEEDPFEDMPTPEVPGDVKAPLPTIRVNFAKLIIGQKVRKFFEIENCGDTVVDIVLFGHHGRELKENEEAKVEKISYFVSPAATVIPAKSKCKFTVTARGVRTGDEEFWMQLRTRTLTDAKVIPILVRGRVFSPDTLLQDSVRAFARSDNSIEELLNWQLQDEKYFNSERDLWKIYIPVMRVKPGLPSQDIGEIPPVEPSTNLPDIGPYITRPPAIPRDLPPRAKKWYMSRTSMALEQENKLRIAETRGNESTFLRRKEALAFVKPLEKQVNLEKRRRF